MSVSNKNSDSLSEDGYSLKVIFQRVYGVYQIILKNIFGIFLFSLLGGGIGFLYAWKTPINFIATTSFIVEEKSGGNSLGSLASLAGQFGVEVGASSGGGLMSGDNILLFLKSNSLAREVLLYQFDISSQKSIADEYAEIYSLKQKWEKSGLGKIRFPVFKPNSKYSRIQDSLVMKIVEDIQKNQFSVSRVDKKAGFIEVKTTMRSELLAKSYCELVVKKAVERYVSIKIQNQKNTVEKLQSRVDSVAGLLNKKTISSAELVTSASTLDINPLYKSNSLVATENTIRDKTMLSTIFAAATQNLELAKFSLSQETPVIQIVDAPLLPLKMQKKSKLIGGIAFSMVFGILYIFLILLKRIIKNNFPNTNTISQ
jgi:hypothetical protein